MRPAAFAMCCAVSLTLAACSGDIGSRAGDGGPPDAASCGDAGDAAAPAPDAPATDAPAPGDAPASGDAPAGADAAPAATGCAPLPAPTGAVIDVTPAQVASLTTIVSGAAAGATIRFADGTYSLGGAYLWVAQPGVTLRSASGQRDAVILDGEYASTEVITVAANDVTVADLTIRRPNTHGIHVVSTAAGDTLRTRIYNVRIVDPAEQAIKINSGSAGKWVDDGEIACSRLELTDTGRPHVNPVNGGCYTGGVDGHDARGWTVRDNHIEGFWCPSGLSEHGVHFWTGSRDTLVERNVLRDNARAIGFGLNNPGTGRTYTDDPCPGVAATPDHYRGVIRNNFVAVARAELFASAAGADCAICLWSACRVKVVHNSIVATGAMFNAVEWRFAASTGIEVTNNLATHALMQRENAAATLTTNLQPAPLTLFVDAAGGDLHLAPGAAAAAAVGAGTPLAAGVCDDDIDADPRTSPPDLGADER
ncbi:MAG TPA: hypothetical protein VGQ83_21740 [Polyangia bacterium]|jgi:hypothetical protein